MVTGKQMSDCDYLVSLLRQAEKALSEASGVSKELVRDKCLRPSIAPYIGRLLADVLTARQAVESGK
jgi:hypothetical protein